MLARTKKNISKYNDDFYMFLKNNITPEQIQELTPQETLSILLGAEDQKVKRNELKKFLFSIAIKKVVQTRNEIYSAFPEANIEMLLPDALPGMIPGDPEDAENSEIFERKLENNADLEIENRHFDDSKFDWFNGEDFIDLRDPEQIPGLANPHFTTKHIPLPLPNPIFPPTLYLT